MIEALWALLLLAVLGAATATALFPWPDLLNAGQWIMLAAGAFGIPLELLYFLLLWIALGREGRPKGWYWRSFEHHERLTQSERRWVLPWFYLGALSFLVIAFGIVVVFLSFVAAARQS